jgi:hypothetical protein
MRRRLNALTVLAVSLLPLSASTALAAEFTCNNPPIAGRNEHIGKLVPYRDPDREADDVRPLFRWDGDGGACYQVLITGEIVSGDADKLEWLLQGYESVPGNIEDVQLASPGGDVIEAMTMGRLLKSRREDRDAL